MSHVVKIATQLKDRAAIKAACKRLGWEFVEGQRTYKWYGRSVGDYPLPTGMTAADLGKCHHAIRVPNATYEIGLVEQDGSYVPVWDYWMSGGLDLIKPENGMGGFLQAYAVEKAKAEARKAGRTCTEQVQADGTIKLSISEN